jgi:hypothetical protein
MNDSVNLHMLVFSGDDDSVCSLAGTQMWIWDLGVKAKGQHTYLATLEVSQSNGRLCRSLCYYVWTTPKVQEVYVCDGTGRGA